MFSLGAATLALNLNLPFPFLTYTVSPIWNGMLLVCESLDGSFTTPTILGVINLLGIDIPSKNAKNLVLGFSF